MERDNNSGILGSTMSVLMTNLWGPKFTRMAAAFEDLTSLQLPNLKEFDAGEIYDICNFICWETVKVFLKPCYSAYCATGSCFRTQHHVSDKRVCRARSVGFCSVSLSTTQVTSSEVLSGHWVVQWFILWQMLQHMLTISNNLFPMVGLFFVWSLM